MYHPPGTKTPSDPGIILSAGSAVSTDDLYQAMVKLIYSDG